MFKHSRSTKSFLYQNSNTNRPVGYNNFDSPMKAAFRLEGSSPRKTLSPMKCQKKMKPSRSPLPCRQENYFSGTKNVSPFRRIQLNNYNEQFSVQSNISFAGLIRKNSHTSPNQQALAYSTTKNLQSDRNFLQNTNQFKKLASKLQSSNNNNNKSFVNSNLIDISSNSKPMPQSCKNAAHHQSNKKFMFRNVLTIESIQSPEDCREKENSELGKEIRWFDEVDDVATLEKVRVNANEPKMQRKLSHKTPVKGDVTLTFGNIQLGNEKKSEESHRAIDFHLTNSFGTAARLKTQPSNQPATRKQTINPFEQITQPMAQSSSIRSVRQSNDSVFASVQMLLQKVDDKQGYSVMNANRQEQQSINISRVSDREDSELDMEPFIQRNH